MSALILTDGNGATFMSLPGDQRRALAVRSLEQRANACQFGEMTLPGLFDGYQEPLGRFRREAAAREAVSLDPVSTEWEFP